MYSALSTCRVCLVNDERLVSIFESNDSIPLYQKITTCLNSEISMTDSLPSVICEICVEELNISYNFISKCQESERILKESLTSINYYDRLSPNILQETQFIKEEHDVEVFDNVGLEWDEECLDYYNNEITQLDKKSCFDSINKVDLKNDLKLAKKLKHKRKFTRKKLQCPCCGLVSVSKSAFIKHKRKHIGEKPSRNTNCETNSSECKVCGKYLLRRRDVKIHMRLHTGEKPYVCSTCNTGFTQIGTLIRHKRVHTGEKPFACEQCGKRFADRTMVKLHQDVHSDVRSFSCDICGKWVKSKSTLIKHVARHFNTKSNVCHKCGTAYSTKGNLKTHISKMHSDSSGVCSVCQKMCSNLVSHMRKHDRGMPFECKTCHQRFMQKSRLSAHMKKHKYVRKLK